MDFYSVNDYCREQFGKKLYKLSLDGGFTCPNRDGTVGSGGCIFCSGMGSGEFAERGNDIGKQIENAKKRIAEKADGCGYIAYFQSFTNTYAPVDRLRELFSGVIAREDIDVLSVATRPDCLEIEKTELFGELNKIKPVWVELGLQTSNEATAEFIRRGYKNDVYTDAVRRLKEAGVYVVTHIIIGLPGETPADMKNTLSFAVKAGTDGVKLQLLHVLKGTELYEMWKKGEVRTLSKEEYLYILSELLPMLPENIAVHRITGDGDKKILAAPLWSADKKDVMNSIKNYGKDVPEIPRYVKQIIDRAEQSGVEAYLVGGCVRDRLLGQSPGDYDIAVSCSPEETLRCFSEYRVIKTGISFGTVTVVSEGHNLELTSFRSDGKYTSFRRPDSVDFTSDIHKDLSRRDFTVNAMAYSPLRGFVDDFNGKKDIEARVIRCVGDPHKRFTEDALRIMRALRFAAVLDFTVDRATAAAAEELKHNLGKISVERIFVELKKMLGGKNAERILIKYRSIIEEVLPELVPVSAAKYARNARFVVGCKNDAMRFAALLTGLSAEEAETVCRRLRTDNKFRISVCFFVKAREHFFETPGEAKRFAGENGSERLFELHIFREATGVTGNENLRQAIDDIKGGCSCLCVRDLAVNGTDIESLGFDGRDVGAVLTELLYEVTENITPNRKKALLRSARELMG